MRPSGATEKQHPELRRLLCRGWMHSMTPNGVTSLDLDQLDGDLDRPILIDSKVTRTHRGAAHLRSRSSRPLNGKTSLAASLAALRMGGQMESSARPPTSRTCGRISPKWRQ